MVFEIRRERIQTIQVIATRDKLGRCARGLGELAVIDCAGQHQSADDRGHGRERVFVDTRISLVGRMPGYFDAGWEFFTPSAFRP
jgi:hypothetical protein